MAPRANWKGYLRLSLVSCPIALYPASSLREKVGFNRINRKTGNRLKQQNVDSETGEVVPREDIARGYEIEKGQYLLVQDEEFEAVQLESTRTIDIDQFVPRSEIDQRYIDLPYYIAPDGHNTRMRTMDWDDPAVRAALIKRVGVKKFYRMYDEYYRKNIAASVNGYNIRPIADSGFTVHGKMFKTLDEAKSYAGTLVKRKWGGGRRKKKK